MSGFYVIEITLYIIADRLKLTQVLWSTILQNPIN